VEKCEHSRIDRVLTYAHVFLVDTYSRCAVSSVDIATNFSENFRLNSSVSVSVSVSIPEIVLTYFPFFSFVITHDINTILQICYTSRVTVMIKMRATFDCQLAVVCLVTMTQVASVRYIRDDVILSADIKLSTDCVEVDDAG